MKLTKCIQIKLRINQSGPQPIYLTSIVRARGIGWGLGQGPIPRTFPLLRCVLAALTLMFDSRQCPFFQRVTHGKGRLNPLNLTVKLQHRPYFSELQTKKLVVTSSQYWHRYSPRQLYKGKYGVSSVVRWVGPINLFYPFDLLDAASLRIN